MTTGRIKTKRRIGLLAAALIVATTGAITASTAQAQEQTGATATKDCPNAPANDPYTIGDTVTCTATFINAGAFPATITSLTEQAPFFTSGVGNGPLVDISCTIPGGAVLDEGDILQPGVVCTASFQVTIPNDPAFCNTLFRDRVAVEFLYHTTPAQLTSDAGATHTLAVVCRPTITVTKVADELSKIGDAVNYTITVCNTGLIPVTKTSVIDTIIPGVNAAFGATLAAGACETETFTRTVVAGDPDPLINMVTAIYTAGVQEARATASDSTNLFQPSVDVTKSCSPNPILVGQAQLCTITVRNTSSADTPILEGAVITDTLTGNLLDPANPAVVTNTCTATLAVGATCTITTRRVVLASDPNPLINTVTVTYNPDGFPNIIRDIATVMTIIEQPGGEGCTPGFWKQPQHFDSWVGFTPNQSFEAVFGVQVVLNVGGVPNNNPTLRQALNALGGGVNALARHAVAALLNASSPNVDFDFTVAEVIAIVQSGINPGGLTIEQAKNLLAEANEDGCPLS